MTYHGTYSPHLPDDDLIAFVYSGNEGSAHLQSCLTCQQRLSVLRANREAIEDNLLPTVDVAADQMAAQRRRIYAKLSPPKPLWSKVLAPRWLSAGATVLILSGGLLVFEYQHHETSHVMYQASSHADDKISDADLAQEVSNLSRSGEPMPAGPLEGLFE